VGAAGEQQQSRDADRVAGDDLRVDGEDGVGDDDQRRDRDVQQVPRERGELPFEVERFELLPRGDEKLQGRDHLVGAVVRGLGERRPVARAEPPEGLQLPGVVVLQPRQQRVERLAVAG
jgi:hypothetical protein